MSQQEDDLRPLAKIMDLLRALSIVVMVANIYNAPNIRFCFLGGL